MMPTVIIEDEPYTLTERQRAEYDALVAAHFDALQAYQIATGEFQDMDPPVTPEES